MRDERQPATSGPGPAPPSDGDDVGARRILLWIYLTFGPVFAGALYLLSAPSLRAAVATLDLALVALGVVLLLPARRPGLATWIVAVAVTPVVTAALGGLAPGAAGSAFRALLPMPALLAAVLFEAPVAAVALALAAAAHLAVEVPRFGTAAALGDTMVWLPPVAAVAWVSHRAARHLREARRTQAGEARRLRGLLAAMPDVVFRSDCQGRFLEVLAPEGEALPRPAAALAGVSLTELVSPEVGVLLLAAIARACDTGEVSQVEYEVTYPDGARAFEVRYARAGPGEVVGIRRDVTARRRAERDQQYLAALVDTMGESVITSDLEHRVVSWSKGAERLFGWSAAEAVGRTTTELIGGGLPDGTGSLLERLLGAGTLHTDTERRRKDGRLIRCEATFVLLRDRTGNPSGILGVSRDVTESREERDRVAAVAREQDLMLEGARVGIAKLVDRRIAWVNRQVGELFGYARDELIGKTTSFLYPDEEAFQALGRRAYPVLATGRIFQADQAMVHRDGRHLWIRVTGQALAPADLSRGTVWMLEDVTEQRSSRQRLAESEERLGAMLSSIPEGVVLLDGAGRVTACNPAAARLLGVPREQLEGSIAADERWRLLREDGSPLPPEEHPGLLAVRGGQPRSGVVAGLERPGGGRRWLSVSAEPVRAAPGEPPRGAVVTFSDVTGLLDDGGRLPAHQAQPAAALEAGGESTYRWNLRTGEVRRTPGLAAALGLQQLEVGLPARLVPDRIHPDDVEAVRTAMREVEAGRSQTFSVECRVRAPDGAWRWVHSHGNRLPDGADPVIAGTVVDVNDRRLAQERIAAELQLNQQLAAQLRFTLEHVKTLKGLIPICMHCHKIRDDAGYWDQLEDYVSRRTEAEFSHGLCPECMDKHYPGSGGGPGPN